MPFMYSRDARASIDEYGRFNADSEYEVDDALSQRQDSTWGSGRQRMPTNKWLSEPIDSSSDEEDIVHARFTRDDLRPFDQAPYPPQAPDARDLPRAVDDDWCDRKQATTDYSTGLPLPSMVSYDYERYNAQQPPQQQHYASHSQYHLPPLAPYFAQPVPYGQVDQFGFAAYAPSATIEDPVVTKDILTTALSQWYAERVVELLTLPGFFRAGVDGADAAEWGRAGRERDEWRRVGRAVPRETSSWGRMGMEPVPSPRYAPALPTPPRVPQESLPRHAEYEQRDPYNLGAKLSDGPSKSLVSFVKSLMAQMTVSPVGLFAALWFLHGLGWHVGDGSKGAKLRAFLQSLGHREDQPVEAEGIQRRIVVLGMLLSNKWLDDNTFTNRSWSDVTHIPIHDIAKLETIALNDLHYSLYISPSSWATHIGQIHHHMTSGPGAIELAEPWLSGFINNVDMMIDEAVEVENFYGPVLGALGDSACAKNPWAIDAARLHQHEALQHPGAGMGWGREAEAEAEWEKHFALDNVHEVFMDDEEDVEEDFLEYDGAQVFEPAQVRRTSSHRSMMDFAEPQVQQAQAPPQRAVAPPSILAWSAKTYEQTSKPRQDFGYPGQQREVSVSHERERERYQPWAAFEQAEQARQPWVHAKW